MTSELRLRVLHAGDATSLYELRESAYRERYGEDVDTRELRWNPNFTHTLDLGLFEEDALVSAYRLDRVTCPRDADFLLQTSVETNPRLSKLSYPFALGCRACTRLDRQGYGYHFTLRLAAIQLLRETGVSFLVSTFANSSHWTNTLRKAGYEVSESSTVWSDFLKSRTPPLVGILDLKAKANQAADVLESKLQRPVKIGDEMAAPGKWGAHLLQSEAVLNWTRDF